MKGDIIKKTQGFEIGKDYELTKYLLRDSIQAKAVPFENGGETCSQGLVQYNLRIPQFTHEPMPKKIPVVIEAQGGLTKY